MGRRVAERRQELGLSGGGGHPDRHEPDLRPGCRVEPVTSTVSGRARRLAGALETTADAISGGGWAVPPGGADPSAGPSLEQMSAEECQAMVAPGGVGRFVYSNKHGPLAVPVNFRVLDGDIVFRTDSEAMIGAVGPAQEVSFEVDHLDEALTEGWSVLLTGNAWVVAEPTEIGHVRSLGLAPWAGGERRTYVRLAPRQVTGRRIRRRAGDG